MAGVDTLGVLEYSEDVRPAFEPGHHGRADLLCRPVSPSRRERAGRTDATKGLPGPV